MNQSHCYKVQALILKLKHSVVIKVTENYLISETVTHLNTNWAIIVSFERVCVCVCVGGGGGGGIMARIQFTYLDPTTYGPVQLLVPTNYGPVQLHIIYNL